MPLVAHARHAAVQFGDFLGHKLGPLLFNVKAHRIENLGGLHDAFARAPQAGSVDEERLEELWYKVGGVEIVWIGLDVGAPGDIGDDLVHGLLLQRRRLVEIDNPFVDGHVARIEGGGCSAILRTASKHVRCCHLPHPYIPRHSSASASDVPSGALSICMSTIGATTKPLKLTLSVASPRNTRTHGELSFLATVLSTKAAAMLPYATHSAVVEDSVNAKARLAAAVSAPKKTNATRI